MMRKTIWLGLAAGMAIVFAPAQKANAAINAADVIFVVDESGSMGGEHAWLGGMVASLQSDLLAAGIGSGADANQYALVGFGGTDAAGQVGHKHLVGGGDWGTAGQLATAAGGLVVSGGTEDGWQAIDFALNNYALRAGAALNIILITDEDRDNVNGNALTFAGVRDAILAENGLLNVVVNNAFKNADLTTALGVDAALNSYKADGSGGYTSAAGGTVGVGAGTTKANYVDMALATGGAAWDLNQLRFGGLTAQSFTEAFVDIKVQEIVEQAEVPEPATIAVWGGLMGLAVVMQRRRKNAA